jgi:hypothetical protein
VFSTWVLRHSFSDGDAVSEVVNCFPMQAETRSLFELLLAPVDLAHVREVLSVDIHVLSQVLFLSKKSSALLTFELLLFAVNGKKVTFQTEPR